jgi:hypothetical protein
MFVSALAILGAALNAWILAGHVTSVALMSMQADDIVICSQKGAERAPTSDDDNSGPRRHCPICSGLAVLHLGVLNDPGINVPLRAASMSLVSERRAPHVLDRRPDRLLNRGPPYLRA